MKSGVLRGKMDFVLLPEGSVIEDGMGDRMLKTARGWVVEGQKDPAYFTDEHVHSWGEGKLISRPSMFDPEIVTVDQEFLVQGQNPGIGGYDGSEQLSLYFMSDGTIRWRKP